MTLTILFRTAGSKGSTILLFLSVQRLLSVGRAAVPALFPWK
jgi:hypothetical protein